MDNTQINVSVRQFILSNFPSARSRPLYDTDPLIERGIIDSMGVLDIVTFIESEFKVTVDDEELIPDNFQSISQMALYIEKKRVASAIRIADPTSTKDK
jgi:acyl carrier protein